MKKHSPKRTVRRRRNVLTIAIVIVEASLVQSLGVRKIEKSNGSKRAEVVVTNPEACTEEDKERALERIYSLSQAKDSDSSPGANKALYLYDWLPFPAPGFVRHFEYKTIRGQ